MNISDCLSSKKKARRVGREILKSLRQGDWTGKGEDRAGGKGREENI